MILQYGRYDRRMIAKDCFERYSPQAVAKQLESVFYNVINKEMHYAKQEN